MYYLLPPSICNFIYTYLTWSDLINYPCVPDSIWASWFYKFGGTISKKPGHKQRFMGCLHHRLSYVTDLKNRKGWSGNEIRNWRSWKDKDFVHRAVQLDGSLMCYVSPDIKENKTIALASLNNTDAIHHIAPHLLDDPDFMLAAVKINVNILRHCTISTTVALHIFDHYPVLLSNLNIRTEKDPELLYKVVCKNGLFLKYASPSLLQDSNIVLTAINQNPLALKFASNDLKKNADIISQAVQHNGLTLQYSLVCFNSNIVLLAVRQNGLALQYAAPLFKNDKNIVVAAVAQNGLAIQYASYDFKNDPEIVLLAVQQNGLALQYTSREKKQDRHIVLEAVRQNGLALEHTGIRDNEIVRTAIRQNALAIKFCFGLLEQDATALHIVTAAFDAYLAQSNI